MGKIERVREIANETLKIIGEYSKNEGFEDLKRGIEENVSKLLDSEKPKLMVCGVYSAGKSTIVNTLLDEEVAEMGAQPKTDKISEYVSKNNDYILVDSPGVDSHYEHEKTTDEYIKKCHAIMFVISSKNAESEKNYKKINEWMEYKKPLIIVINAKGGEGLNSEIIEKIRMAIEENMRKSGYSRDAKYDVVAVNALAGFKSIGADMEKKQRLLTGSNMVQLGRLIDDRMKDANTVFLAPIGELTWILSELEDKLMAMEVGNDDENLKDVFERIDAENGRINETLRKKIEMACNDGRTKLINAYMSAQSEGDIENATNNIQREIVTTADNDIKTLLGRFSTVASESLSKYDISVDKDCNVTIDGKTYAFGDMINESAIGSSEAIKSAAGGAIIGEMIGMAAGKIIGGIAGTAGASAVLGGLTGAGAGSALGTAVGAGTGALATGAASSLLGGGLGMAGSALAGLPLGPIGMIGGAIVGLIFGGKMANQKREAEMQRQIAEENRRRQEARDAYYKKVQASVDSKMREVQNLFTEKSIEIFTNAVSIMKDKVNEKLAENTAKNEKIAETRKKISQLKAELEGLKNSIN